MHESLGFVIQEQPTHTSCGPTCLHGIYSFFEDHIKLSKVIKEISDFEEGGGTLGVVLANHALKRGYDVTVYTYNINIFDPTWFQSDQQEIIDSLAKRRDRWSADHKEVFAINSYIKFLERGGKIRMETLSKNLIRSILSEKVPIITGLSSTWLYQAPREDQVKNIDDPIHGDPSGHFVIIEGISRTHASICDPYRFNPISSTNYYKVTFDRLFNSILLGISSRDGNLIVIRKKHA